MSSKYNQEKIKTLIIDQHTKIFVKFENYNLWSEHKAIFNKTTQNIILSSLNKRIQDKVSISILLTDDIKMREINLKWRSIDKTTNILSFPNINIFRENGILNLGDIVISFNTVLDEAKERKILFLDHFRHLLVHGVLHLLGFDHDNYKSMSIMENLEIEILSNYGIENPYLEKTA